MSVGVSRSSTRLSILHVLAPGAVGGLEQVVRALAVGQAARGHRVTAAVILDVPTESELSSPGGPLTHQYVANFAGTGVVAVPIILGHYRYGRERAAVRALCSERQVDVMHTHGRRPDVVDGGVALSRGLPVVSTAHGFMGSGWRARAHDFLQRRAHRRCDAVIAVSDEVADLLVRRGVSKSRVHVIPNAYEPRTALLERAPSRARLGLDDRGVVVGWVGRLSREKGLDVLLAAVAEMGDRPLTVAVLGTGREQTSLEAESATRGVARAVRWLGAVPDAAQCYRAFDLFVLSSRTEGTPIALFEAMDAQVPIVATAVGGVPAVVTSAEALLVPPEDPPALARAIAQVLDDPAGSRARAAAAHARLRANYGIGPWLDRHDQVYARIAGRRS